MMYRYLRCELAALVFLTAMLTGCSGDNPAETESAPETRRFPPGPQRLRLPG